MRRKKKLRYKSEDVAKLEKLATVFSKYDVLFNPSKNKPKSHQIKLAQIEAYKELARELNLPDISTLKVQIKNLKSFSYRKMRRIVSRTVNRGLHGLRDALRFVPEWLQKLVEPWKLLEKALKAESESGFRSGSAVRRVEQLVWELLRCAEREAARGRCALTARSSLRAFAHAARLDLDQIHAIWTRYYDQAVHKLMASIDVGDCSERLGTLKRFSLQDWRVIDAGLLYDMRLRVVQEQSFNNALTLYPMIQLFKLMIAAKRKIDQINAAKLKSNESHTGRQEGKSGARTETKESTTVNNNKEKNATQTHGNESEHIVSTSQPRLASEITEEELSIPKGKADKKTRNEYETAEIWALVHSNYTNCGRAASAVLLQKRWYEMKQQTRALLCGASPVPLLLAIAKRFPFILTETLPSWKELVRTDQVFLDCDLEPYKMELLNIELQIPDIDENVLLDEINDWSDDEVEIINEKREVITVFDSDDEQTNTTIRKPNMADVPRDNHLIKIEESDSSIKELERLDPTSAKVKIIFEDDSDSDVNEFLNDSEGINNEIFAFNSDENLRDLNSGVNKIAQFSKDTENSSNNSRTKDASSSSESKSLGIDRYNISSNNKTKTVKDEKVNYLHNTIPTGELNTASPASHKDKVTTKTLNNALRKDIIKTESNEQLDDTNLQLDGDNNDAIMKNERAFDSHLLIADISHTYVEDTSRNHETHSNAKELEDDESESLDGSVKCEISDDSDSTFVDEKLVKLAHVVLTPLEDLEAWRKFSKSDTINCRRFSVRNFAKLVNVTSKQLAKCRPYITPYFASGNSISSKKILELNEMPKTLKHKRRYLTKHLKLSRTYFSLEFWNERNVGLLESCKPVVVKLERMARVVKKVELSNIDEVRRINRTILTAQVAPITLGSNRTIVIDSTKLQAPAPETLVQPSNISIDNQKSNDVTTKVIPAYYVNLSSEAEVKEMIKNIVRKGGLAKLPDPVTVVPATDDTDFREKQRMLDRDIREMSLRLAKQRETKAKSQKETKQPLLNTELKLDPNINCSQEWQRQKSQNLIYFDLRPKAYETDREIQNQTNTKTNAKKKRKKPKTPKENTEVEKEASVIQSENVNDTIKLKSVNLETVSDVINVTKHLESTDSEVTRVSSRKSSESDSEINRLVINLDTTDQDLKRKSLDTPSDVPCKISKIESNVDTKTNTTNIASDCVIDLCDDSNDKVDSNIIANDPDGLKLHDKETQNTESVSQIKIKIVQNTIEINGDCESTVPEDKNGEILKFLSKVAARIQESNKTAASTPTPLTNNSTVYYVVKSVDKDQQSNESPDITPNKITEAICKRTTNIQPLNVNTDVPNDANVSITEKSSSPYYVVKLPDVQTTSVIPESLSPPMPIIQSVSSLKPKRTKKSKLQPNLRTLLQNFGYDNMYEKQLSSTSVPMRRNNSVPMPITSVTALPRQNDAKIESSALWPNTGHPALTACQQIYPVTVTSGNSRSETVNEGIEDRIQMIPIWNIPETNFMPKIAPTLSINTQAKDLISVKKEMKTYQRKRVCANKRADETLNDEECVVKKEFPIDIVENGVALPPNDNATPENSLRPSYVINRKFYENKSHFDYIVTLNRSTNHTNLEQYDQHTEPMLTIIREQRRKTASERVRAFRERQRALKAIADRNIKIKIPKTSTERSREFRARQKAKQSVDGTANETPTDDSVNEAREETLGDENILKPLSINRDEMVNNSSSESEDVKTEVTD